MADFNVRVVVDPRPGVAGTRRVQNQLENLNRTADRTRTLIRRAFQFAGGALLLRQVVQLTDAFNNLQNRFRVVTNGMGELQAATQAVFEVSQRTRSSFTSTGELFTRVSIAARELGISQRETLEFTESLNQAIIVSGASAQEANAGLIQLSQGLASGRLRGDELRSVLEQLPVVSDIIAQELGVTRGELRELGAEGAITSDIIIRAFANSREELAERFGKTIPTIGQAFTQLQNQVVLTLGRLSEFSGATNALVVVIQGLADNLDTVLRILGTVTSFMVGQFIPRGLLAARAAVVALNTAILANPLGALLKLLQAATIAIVFFSDKIRVPGTELATLRDLGVAVFEQLASLATQIGESISSAFTQAFGLLNKALEFLGLDFQDVARIAKDSVNTIVAIYVGLARVLALIFGRVRTAISKALGPDFLDTLKKGVTSTIDFARRGVDRLFQFARQGLELIGLAVSEIQEAAGETFVLPDIEIPDSILNLGRDIREEFTKGFGTDFVGDVGGFIDDFTSGVRTRADELARLRAAQGGAPELSDTVPAGAGGLSTADTEFQELLASLQKQGELLQKTNSEREIEQELLRIQKDLTNELTEAQRTQVVEQLQLLQGLTRQAEIFDEIRGPEQELLERRAALIELYRTERITLQELNEELFILQQRQAENSNTITGGFSAGLLEISNRFNNLGMNVQNFVVGAFDQATDALVNFATTGKFEFRSFVADVLQQLGKLALQIALTAALRAALGGPAGAGQSIGNSLGGLLSGGAQGGLDVAQNGLDGVVRGSGGTDSQLVAFRATPGERVQVQTPAQQSQDTQPVVVQAPPVNVVNVTSPDDIPAGIESVEGEQSVLNVLSRNAEAVKAITR